MEKNPYMVNRHAGVLEVNRKKMMVQSYKKNYSIQFFVDLRDVLSAIERSFDKKIPR